MSIHREEIIIVANKIKGNVIVTKNTKIIKVTISLLST